MVVETGPWATQPTTLKRPEGAPRRVKLRCRSVISTRVELRRAPCLGACCDVDDSHVTGPSHRRGGTSDGEIVPGRARIFPCDSDAMQGWECRSTKIFLDPERRAGAMLVLTGNSVASWFQWCCGHVQYIEQRPQEVALAVWLKMVMIGHEATCRDSCWGPVLADPLLSRGDRHDEISIHISVMSAFKVFR